jgi:Lrp/AsnC family leucine-responsive transcriptional regulator
MPEVVECYLVTGNYDYLLHLRMADVEMFKNFVRERLINIASVGQTISSIALEQTKYTTAVALPSNGRLRPRLRG